MPQVVRATFQAVFSAQERLRKHLDVLIEENRPIKDENERALFWKEISFATLGFGSDLIINYYHKINGALLRKDIQTVARWLSYQTKIDVEVPSILLKWDDNVTIISIGKLWETLRDNFFTIFPIALHHSASMSREQDGQRKPSGHMIKEDH